MFRQLSLVIGGDLPAPLRSDFVCVSCQRRILTALKQKERADQSRRELLQKLASTSASPTARTQSPRLQLPSRPEKRPRSSPFARSGVSPLTKRALSEATHVAESLLTQHTPRRELFPKPDQVSPSRIPVPARLCIPHPVTSTGSRSPCSPQEVQNTHVLPSRIPLPTGRTVRPLPQAPACGANLRQQPTS